MAWNNLVEIIIWMWDLLNRVTKHQVSIMAGICCLADKCVSRGLHVMELAM
jgi:hypothetical protein